MTARTRTGSAVLGLALAGAGAAAGVAAVVARDPHLPGTFGTCPSLLVTGFACPGCGSLRATHDVMTGQVAEAFAHNVLTVPALIWLAWWWAARMVAAVTGRDVPGPPSSSRFAVVLLVVLVLFTVARNVPGSPLAP